MDSKSSLIELKLKYFNSNVFCPENTSLVYSKTSSNVKYSICSFEKSDSFTVFSGVSI